MLPVLEAGSLAALARTMLAMRRFEERLILTTQSGVFVGHFHVYIGQECTGAPALALLRDEDTIFTTHRNHGHLIARGADPARIFAEIMGKNTGYNHGKGGTLHVTARKHGFLATSALVGGAVPLAAGAALAAREQGRGAVNLCLFGDGVLEEGVFFETVNLAALWKLPLILLCENNSAGALGQAAGEYPGSTIAVKELVDAVRPFGLPVASVDGSDVGAVHDAVRKAIVHARSGGGASFIEAKTLRWPGSRPLWPELSTGETMLEHAWNPEAIGGPHADWIRSDGLLRFLGELIDSKEMDVHQVQEMDAEVREAMSDAVRRAIDAPYPDPATALQGVFA